MLHCTLVAADDGKYYNGRDEGFARSEIREGKSVTSQLRGEGQWATRRESVAFDLASGTSLAVACIPALSVACVITSTTTP